MSCRLAIIVGAFLLCCTNSSVWEQHRIGSYTYIFRQSKREVSRQQQFDPMLIWIGSASNALQVSYTHGPVPLPTIWSSFVNVLYVTKCDSQATPFTEQFLAFYASWLLSHESYSSRDIFLMANMRDEDGGVHILDIAHAMQSQYSLRSVILVDPPFTPTGIFVSHRSFESGNGMGDYSIQRVQQPVTCNAYFSEVSFMMNDVTFHYVPQQPDSTSLEMFEYHLASISTYDRCFQSADDFASEWLQRSLPSHGQVFAALASSPDISIFPKCNDERPEPSLFAVNELLQENVTVLSYKQIYHSSQLICSFYISIYEAEALSLSHRIDSGTTQYFDHATLQKMDFSTKHKSNLPLGLVQDSIEGSLGADSTGRFVWMQFDSRASITTKTSQDYEYHLTKPTAVDILRRLVNDEYGDISFVELLL